MRARLAGTAAILTVTVGAGLASSRLDPASFDSAVGPQDDLYAENLPNPKNPWTRRFTDEGFPMRDSR
jgi:hypothetical protein